MSNDLKDPQAYAYGTIAYLGGWTFVQRAVVSPDGTITTGHYTGYGDPFRDVPELATALPVVNLQGNWEATEAAIRCPDALMPRETQPKFHQGTLETYLGYLAEHGVEIIYPKRSRLEWEPDDLIIQDKPKGQEHDQP